MIEHCVIIIEKQGCTVDDVDTTWLGWLMSPMCHWRAPHRNTWFANALLKLVFDNCFSGIRIITYCQTEHLLHLYNQSKIKENLIFHGKIDDFL